MPTILIIDDEKNIRSTLSRGLGLEGYRTLEAVNGAEGLETIDSGEIDLVILDLQMPLLDGLQFLEKAADKGLGIPVLVLTAHGTIEKAVRAIRLGAVDFIEKPPAMERILVAVANALRLGELQRQNRDLAEEAGLGGEILGESEPVRELLSTIGRVAATNAGVLIVGENGSGKELVARAIHAGSNRCRNRLVTLNCAAIPAELFESELFGHVRGSFTGAVSDRRGKFQQADRGTLFLDEIAELPLALQPKMLRALESGEVERVGGRSTERVDVRVIAATNRDLEREVRDGKFREDLYYRLLVVPVRVPPLRERGADITLLARHFLDRACRRNRVRPKRLADASLSLLERWPWPGNVRELRNAMERIAILVPGAEIHPSDLEPLFAAPVRGRAGSPGEVPSGPVDLSGELSRYERAIVLAALERNRWRMTQAARDLNIERSHLYKKLKALGIDRPDR